MYFILWLLALVVVDNQLDALRPNPLLISVGMAYVFLGIGWGMARFADMIYSAL